MVWQNYLIVIQPGKTTGESAAVVSASAGGIKRESLGSEVEGCRAGSESLACLFAG
jgi:hypothetical protein